MGSTERFYSVEGDIETLSRIVAKHLAAKKRLMSPVYLAGESYGGFRIPRIARELQGRDGVGGRPGLKAGQGQQSFVRRGRRRGYPGHGG
jgi:carboxypeptidase C (cathepsin A)